MKGELPVPFCEREGAELRRPWCLGGPDLARHARRAAAHLQRDLELEHAALHLVRRLAGRIDNDSDFVRGWVLDPDVGHELSRRLDTKVPLTPQIERRWGAQFALSCNPKSPWVAASPGGRG